MRQWRHSHALLLLLLLAFMTACGRSAPPATPAPVAVTLDSIWLAAAEALDGSLNATQRQLSRDQAMASLLAYLKLPESVQVTRDQWERPAREGHGPLVRPYVSGPIRVYAMTLPLSGVVPPGERLAVQASWPAGLQSFEVSPPAGGQLAGARFLQEAGTFHLSLAFVMPRGGMAVAHYQQDARSGEFKPLSGAFRGLPNRFEDYSLDQRDGFLVLSTPIEMEPRPRYDEKHPLMLFLDGELGLEWKGGRYVVADERNYSAFEGFTAALDDKATKEDRLEAWDKATRKLPAYLHEFASWQDDLTGKLPPGGALRTDQSGNLAVRVISIPAPKLVTEPGFTVVQYRAGNGLPMAQELKLPGIVEDVRIVYRQGLPGLMILTDTAAVHKALSLFGMTGGNDWEPAPSEWFGFLPAEDGMQLEHRNTHHLTIRLGAPQGSVSLTRSPEPGAQVCNGPDLCFDLTWIGGRLSGTGWVAGKLRAMMTDPALTTSAVGAVKAFLESPEAAGLSAAELANVLGAGQGVPVQVFTAGPEGQAVVLPPALGNSSPILFLQGQTLTQYGPADSGVDRWTRIWEVQGEGGRWLVILGRNLQGDAAMRLYRVNGGAWQAVNVVDVPISVNLGDKVNVQYQPGPTGASRDLFIQGHSVMEVTIGQDGRSVAFCEQFRFCAVYEFAGSHWVFK